MILYILNGATITLLILLFVLYSIEKRNNNERINNLNQEIKNAKDYLFTYANNKIEASEKQIDDRFNVLNNEWKNIISSLENKIENETNRKLDAFFRTYNDRLESIQEEDNKKIKTLAELLVELKKDNEDLKKKLEFFTEIEEDSRNLTEANNNEERDALIQAAISELIGDSSIAVNQKTEPLELPKTISIIRDENEKNTPEIIVPEENRKETIITGTTDSTSEKEVNHLLRNAPTVLDDEQRMAFSIMSKTNDNLFITGKAGTGKSFLLDVFVRSTPKKTLKLAPTGIAALNIGGATLHSTFGFNNLEKLSVDEITRAKIRLSSAKQSILKNVETIIIDEISMVRADIFDKIDKLLRVLNRSAKPFGGKQVIVFGDPFQLPPIANSQETKYLTDYYGGIFFFNSNAYNNGQFHFIELTKNHRQKEDQEFFDILNRMRQGRNTHNDIEVLNSRYTADRNELRRVLTLFPKKADADKVNKEELRKIEAKEYLYKARIVFNAKATQNPALESSFPITDELRLKRGALVMMVANDPEKRWVNGSMGVVHSLGDDYINVVIDGTKYEVYPYTFTEKEAVYENGQIEYHDILSIEQYPVVLAYAITIHKSQGMTYKKVACDISQCFAPGQSYVALSRCSGMDGLFLLNYINDSQMKVDDSVKNFYLSQSTDDTFSYYS